MGDWGIKPCYVSEWINLQGKVQKEIRCGDCNKRPPAGVVIKYLTRNMI